MDGERTAAMEAYPDAQFCSFSHGEGLKVAVSCLMHRNIIVCCGKAP
jgi:hypothetical protein